MDSFVARQAIFDKDRNVFAYELLFRTSLENRFPDFDADAASCNVMMDNFIVNSVTQITEGKRAFVNFSEKLLLEDFALYLPKEKVVIEILETIPANAQTIAACKKLRDAGYTVALDDFVMQESCAALMDWVHIIKVDYRQSTPEIRQEIIRRTQGKNIALLAEKVETQEDFQRALEEGFTYFQGYFFCKPEVLQGKRMTDSKVSKLQLIQAINSPEPNFDQIAEIIKKDVSLTYKLLRCINAAANGFTMKIESVQQAVVYLGFAPLRKWINFIAMADLGSDKPSELVSNALLRARFCEQLSPLTGFKTHADDLFLMGLFSRVDAIMDRAMQEILPEVPLSEDIKTTLLGNEHEYGYVYDLVKSYETGDWATVQEICDDLGVDVNLIPDMYNESLQWTKAMMSMTRLADKSTDKQGLVKGSGSV